MATSAAARTRATTKYIKEHTRRFTLQCHREYDADIIAFLESKGNCTAYLKGLIRAEIEREKL
ncbi:hypothetical protein AAY81_04005 [Denitrobacterium detoxificans]|uniref:Uncharacterized protein n=1 Tax=Denitrobacterium detoxificans TaxID=79604 RepID=A0A172RXS4_9ACTN|nr:hypothetical protein [Denitrobacterium detoxificans]ANE22423.1 hypothetical protein AAY81_04005 [Denitrobacterium detoxificans]SEO81902.1 hypothetical protein SAMN02910314_01311 [Denitrobacterium detoxificans]SEP01818.1 hypothetical protein SAMN02910314_01935 [Denitrobacterium detoxificans]